MFSALRCPEHLNFIQIINSLTIVFTLSFRRVTPVKAGVESIDLLDA